MSSEPAIEVDATRYPIVIQRWNRDPTAAELAAYFETADTIADRAIAEDSYYVVVVVNANNISPQTRRALSAFIDETSDERRRRVLGSFVVMTSAALRGVLTALKWVTKRLDDVHVVATVEEGMQKANERLRLGR